MGTKMAAFLLFSLSQILVIAAETDPRDLAVLNSLKENWKNLPINWVGSDPCGSGWDGINCTDSRVTSMVLQGMDVMGTDFGDISSFSALEHLDLSNNKRLKGTLPSSIGNLKNLSSLILIGCNFFGPIPESIGSLQNLVFLALNSNSFSKSIPHSIGNLSKLVWLDLSDNKLSGSIPVSSGTLPGLDMLVNTLHFHFGQNQLSGTIPLQLFSSNMKLIHVCIDNNQLTGSIPPSLGYVQTLEVVRLDSNLLNGSVPQNINNLTNLNQLYLSNNSLNGPVPNLTGMKFLSYVDLSNNSFSSSNVPLWFTALESLNTLLMERTHIQGGIPVELFSSPNLMTLILSNNQLNGTLDISTSLSNQLRLIDLQNNSIENLVGTTGIDTKLILVNNPFCNGIKANERYCGGKKINSSFTTQSNHCTYVVCSHDKTLSRNCKCAVPYTGTLHFIYFPFLLDNSSYFPYLEEFLMHLFQKENVPVDSVLASYPDTSIKIYRQLTVQFFPSSRDHFNKTEIAGIGTLLNGLNSDLLKDLYFGAFYFCDERYLPFGGTRSPSHTGTIIGAAVAVSVLVLLVLTVGVYAFHQKKRAEQAHAQQNPFASWDPQRTGESIPNLQGARWFSFMELKKCTDDFSEANSIGSGGYGKVYRGTLPNGKLVAIKRAQQGSCQGAFEFKTEIELLSRIHHKNVVNLVGFCYDEGEQMLVYEYIPNGTLMESLSGKLDWKRRLSIALDSARGLSYLHELADPPIIHRDIKSANILLDDNLNAKVADFGLSKLMPDNLKGYISTQVKGTVGYMDPEYYMTQQLTEKSDVYSFGVVLLELITGRRPIERGKHLVGEVNEARNRSEGTYNLYEILDSSIDWGISRECIEVFLDLALRCVGDSSSDRPTMGEVVREIEKIIGLAFPNLNFEPAFTSSSFYGETDEYISHSDGNEVSFNDSSDFVPFRVEHQRGRVRR